jgi:D-amino-acid dehydrogenase
MKVIVLGAGVIGVSTAYFLAKSGHEVVVIDRASSSAEGCSSANGGQLSYSHIETWSNKSSLMSMAKNIFLPSSYLYLKDFSNKEFYSWIAEFVKNSSNDNYVKNSEKLFKISTLSRALMYEIISEEASLLDGKSFDFSKNGILHFYRNKKNFEAEIKKLEKFNFISRDFEIFSAEECVKKEPNLTKLSDEKNLAGGVFFKNDESGDCHKFTQELEKICKEKYEVKFIHNCDIKNLLTNYKKITGINTSEGVLVADKYVYALGASSISLLKGIGIETKIYPVKGYSLSIKCDEKFIAPNMAMTDNENKIVYSRLGDIFRVAGTIEMSGNNLNMNKQNLNFLYNNVQKTFADFGDIQNAKEWVGIRPFRPNSIPLIGDVAKFSNLLINSGHGSLGWTNSLASAKIIDDLLAKKPNKDFNFLNKEIHEEKNQDHNDF